MIRSLSRWSCRRFCLTSVLLTLALLAGTRVLWPPALDAVAEFSHVRPADLAHLLADVTTHTLIPSPWTLEEESGNYTSWRYVVSYACGARCAGRASVAASEERAADARLSHGAAATHRVRVRRQRCRSLPLLPWPSLCDEIETEWLITSSGSGARLSESARAHCGVAAALLLACPGAGELATARDTQLKRLRDLLKDRGANSYKA